MNDWPESGRPSRAGARKLNAWTLIAALVIGVVLSFAFQTWRQTAPDWALGQPGTLHAVFLTNGQAYYGTLERSSYSALVLTKVFYVQISVDPQGNQRISKLMNRTDEDWHAPLRMSIPLDKILFVEVVGPDSRIAKLIAEATKQGKSQ